MRDVLLLAPHSDDVAWSVGGLARRLGREGAATLVTVFTRSAFGPGVDGEGEAAVSAARKAEDARFARACGLRSVALDRVDAALRGVPFAALFKGGESPDEEGPALAEQLDELRAQAGEALVLAPLGIGRHVDHFSCRDAARRVFEPDALVFYEDQPYAADAGAAACAELAARWLGPEAGARVVPLADPEGKAELARMYASQLAASYWPKIRAYAQALRSGSGAERVWGRAAALAALDEALAGG